MAPDNQFNVQTVLEDFRNTDFKTSGAGNTFFETHGVGNAIGEINHPFERFREYEKMMRQCQATDPEKYQQMHKGTPFYLMSWLCFDMRAYSDALFYIDAAISEDIRAEKDGPTPDQWKNAPATRFLTLDAIIPGGLQTATRTIKEITELLKADFARFNGISDRPAMTLQRWRAFVRSLLETPPEGQQSKRTIVSALYIFMLEFNHRMEHLKLRRGSIGGSNQPFTVHLFTGGLLFESLLKHFFAPHAKTLGGCFDAPGYVAHFGPKTFPTGNSELKGILKFAGSGPPAKSVDVAFGVASQLRNTTGHNLVWDDVFEEPSSYKTLYEQVMNALLFLIERNTGVMPTTSVGVQITVVSNTEATTTTQTDPPVDPMAYSSTVATDRVIEVVRDKPTS